MKRVHSHVIQSGEIVFVDSSGGVDRHGCRVFVMMTHSAAGGLPLGVLITSSESEKVLTEGFQLLKDLFPPVAFFGRQEKGPKIIMTDDAEAERKALHSVHPESTLLLCSFHILQALWRYLWDAKHKVKKEDRPNILKSVKRLMYARTEADFEQYYEQLCVDDSVQQYDCLVTYLRCLYHRRMEWAHCFRVNVPVRGNNTNNFCEAAIRVMKDKIFYRTKAFNVVQLVDFLFTRLETFYEQKLLNVANNRWKQSVTSRYVSIAGWDLPQSKITQVSAHEYQVPSQSKPDVIYQVDMETAMCSCPLGYTGGPCKHKHVVAKYFSISNVNADPVTSPSLRKLFYKIATGEDEQESWFQSLCETNVELQFGLTQGENPMQACSPTDSQTQLCMDHTEDNHEITEEEAVREIDRYMDHLSKNLRQRIIANPKMFLEPLKNCLDNLENIKTEASLISALNTFGKYSGAAKSLNCNGKMIGVQPGAVARRKTALGGRRCLGSGRPVKRHLSDKEDETKLRPMKSRKKAPHRLFVCVDENKSLCKNHSSKS